MTVEQKKLAHKVSQKDVRWAKKNNREQSKIRSRVEYMFGDMTNSMGGLTIRCIGLAKCVIALKDCGVFEDA
jgi:hypothetical protein